MGVGMWKKIKKDFSNLFLEVIIEEVFTFFFKISLSSKTGTRKMQIGCFPFFKIKANRSLALMGK